MSKTLEISPNALINKKVLDRYLSLQLPENKIMATYIWIDGPDYVHFDIRCKDRVLDFIPKSVNELPIWTAGHGEEDHTYSEWYLHPVAIYKDPFRQGNHILVLCETYSGEDKPSDTNYRHTAAKNAAKCTAEEPWFGIEQEYVFLDIDGHPLGWPKNGFPAPQGPNYCGVGANKAYGRDVVEAHLRACLYAGVNIHGINAEGMAAQWEFQVGPVTGITAADDLWIARFLLIRIAEEFGIVVTFDPKPVSGEWYGSGAHTNVSTKSTRAKGGITAIYEAIEKLSKRHDKHIKAYDPNGGKDNERRLAGSNVTSSIFDFSAGISNRSASIRIPKCVADAGCGYFEDRRPSSNCDPYSVVGVILSTICLNEYHSAAEWYLHPVAIYKDPFRQGKHILVLCETYSSEDKPSYNNYRYTAVKNAAKCTAEEPWFGIEQEYVFLDVDGHPLGWPKYGFPAPKGPNYCGVGANKAYGRDVVEAHLRACLYAGVNIHGTNAEGMAAQWEFQVGPVTGITAADDLWIVRFLLIRIAEEFGIVVTFDPKPVSGEWYGSGAHTNVSTKLTRAKGGITAIHEAIEKLSKRHDKHIKAYDPNGGKDNERRLAGSHVTSSISDFSVGISNRSTSIRIPKCVADAGCGYFEDRRPSSNCDPYSVVGVILSTICPNE